MRPHQDISRSVTAVIVALAASGASLVSVASAGADAADHTRVAPQRRSITISVSVARDDGSPVDGAVVVTSAGGHGVSNADGGAMVTVQTGSTPDVVDVTAVALIDGGTFVGHRTTHLDPARVEIDLGTIIVAASSTCEPGWLPTFGSMPGVDDIARAMTVFDDGLGGGPALYVGGSFVRAGGKTVNRVAKWNGEQWSALGSGMSSSVQALAVWDDRSGNGPALYAGGSFTSAGGIGANRIAKWNGSEWSPLGSGVAGPSSPSVDCLVVHDDGGGDGPSLYAGGTFATAGGVTANNLARWNGSSWSSVGGGVTNTSSPVVADMLVFDDGSGSGAALFVGGNFSKAGAVTVNDIAKWSGGAWTSLAGGTNSAIFSMALFDDGTGDGESLYASGSFTTIGGVSAARVAKWTGTTWTPLGSGLSVGAGALAVYDDRSGGGPALYAGGSFLVAGGVAVNRIARWNGVTWEPVGNGTNKAVNVLKVFDAGDGEGLSLFAGGDFETASGTLVNQVAAWNGSKWSPLGTGMGSAAATPAVNAMAIFDDQSGSGPALYAGGSFTAVGGSNTAFIVKWDGAEWSPLGAGVDGAVNALVVHDDGLGGGPALYAGGWFNNAGGLPASGIARWNGSAWSPLGSGVSGQSAKVLSLASIQNGPDGPSMLYAGGVFTMAGGVNVGRLAKWNGTAWSSVGSGVGPSVSSVEVNAFALYDDGSGSGAALYVGGSFLTAGAADAKGIAKWNGSTWSGVGGGVVGEGSTGVRALTVLAGAEGGAPELYAGGYFESAGSIAAKNVAKWNGESWSALGPGLDNMVNSLIVANDGSGSGAAVFAGGVFTGSGGTTTNRIARWTGAEWSPLGPGAFSSKVYSITVLDDASPEGPALFAGGEFSTSPAGDSLLARWQFCAVDQCAPADLDCSGLVNGFDLALLLGNWGPCDDGSNCLGDVNQDGMVDEIDIQLLLADWGGPRQRPLRAPSLLR